MKKLTEKPTYKIMTPNYTFYFEQSVQETDHESILSPEEMDFPDPEYYEFDDLREK
jgi:hypothetical protein